jgi:hypothetical protein
MGLSQYGRGINLIALVSTDTIGDLIGDGPASTSRAHSGKPPIMGPSVLEGRCHRRWRHWPQLYGRTFQLNDARGGSERDSSGADEAVRKPIPLDEIGDFVYIGQTSTSYMESDGLFARMIGVESPVSSILRDLHIFTGL